jgi:glycosyltransferase involved in cell wall biosynthesis
MTKPPWLSVVIPVFRAEKSIAEAISSVTSQGVDGIEIICVDDCSPDNSVDVICSLQQNNPLLTLIRHNTNQGPGPARNSGIEAATGDYIVFLDSDDSIIDGGLRALEVLTRQAPDLILVACEENRRGKTRSLTEGALQQSLSRHAVTNVSEEPRILFWPPAPWSKVYRREFLNSRSLRLGEGVAQDIPWSAGVTLAAETVLLCEIPFYRYVTSVENSSITTTKSEKNLVRVAQVRAIREGTDVNNLPEHVGQHLSALAAIHLIWSNRAAYRLLPNDSHKSFFDDSVTELRAWLALHPIPAHLDCRQMMSPSDREMFTRALASGDWSLWQRTLARKAKKKAFRRFLRTRTDPANN